MMQKKVRFVVGIICLMITGLTGAETLSQEEAVSKALKWMSGNPVMSRAGRAVESTRTFPENTSYFVYVVELSPKGYLILNSDDRLPLLVAFSADSGVDLTGDPNNALRAMLLNYCEQMEQTLRDMTQLSAAMAAAEAAVEDELYGPFLETSWNQDDPYNLFAPAASGGYASNDGRAPMGCVPVALAQLLNFHRWPVHGAGSRSYTDSAGLVTGMHSADFSDSYDWDNIQASHSPSDSQAVQEAVATLMYELGVLAEANFEAAETSAATETAASRLGSYLFFEAISTHDPQTDLLAPMENDLRAGLPCIVQFPGHAFVADGLMVDAGVTTYHFNLGWGADNIGWWNKDTIPTSSGNKALNGGITSIRPALMAFPFSNAVSCAAGSPAEVNWVLPKRRESEVSQLAIKQLVQQAGTWSSDASEIIGLNSGWEVSPDGYSGDCWYSEQSTIKRGSTSLLLNEVFIPDASAQLTFRQFARLYKCPFTIEVSTDGWLSFNEVYSAYPATTNRIFESSWSAQSVSLSAYAGQQIRLRFRVDSEGGSFDNPWPGIRLDDLAVTSGEWYDWEIFATDTTLASDRFSDVTTVWDDCDDFSVFELTTTAPVYTADWAVTNLSGVGNCFYKPTLEYNGYTYHITSRSPISASSSTRLEVRTKYNLGTAEIFRVLLSTDRSNFSEVWSASDIRAGWKSLYLDLSAYDGMSVYVRFEYQYGGSMYSDSGVWIDSISTQETTNPELEGQPVYYTELSGLSTGTYTLAAALTDTNAVEHAIGPSFTLTVTEDSGPSGDTDSDGLPDWWEELYFGGTTNAVANASAANGVNTLMEAYIAGINPTNSGALFETSLSHLSGFVVQWNAASGRVYSVWSSTNLMTGFQTLETNVVWPQSRWTDSVERTEIFYKIDVSLP